MRKTVALIIIFSILHTTIFSEIKNITKENKTEISRKIKELQRSFYKIKRGKREIKPVNLNELSTILKVTTGYEEMLNNLTHNYFLSYDKIKKIIEGKDIVISLQDASEYLGKVYDISEEIRTSQSFSEIDKVIKCANLQISLYPLRVFLYAKFLQDIYYIKSKLFSEDKHSRLSYLEEKIVLKTKEEKKICRPDEADEIIKKELQELSKEEFRYFKELSRTTDRKKETTLPPSSNTYTIRLKDRLILVYGEEEILHKIKENIEVKKPENFDEIISFLEMYPVHKEIFFQRKEKDVYRSTVRSAILENVIPIIEGLDFEEAKEMLLLWGYTVWRDISEDKIKDISGIIVMPDARGESEVLIIK